MTTHERELYEGADLLSLVKLFIRNDNPFGWTANTGVQKVGSVNQPPVHDNTFSQGVNRDMDIHQYETQSNDRSLYSPSCVYDGLCPNNFLD